MSRSPPPRRRLRAGRLLMVALLAAAVAFVAYFMTCGRGFGLGGGGDGVGLGGKGTGTVAPRPAVGASPGDAGAPPRCQLRLDAAGIHVDGATPTVSREQAIAACTSARAADLTVTGDARYGALDELRAGLEAAGVTVFSRGAEGSGVPSGDGEPTPAQP